MTIYILKLSILYCSNADNKDSKAQNYSLQTSKGVEIIEYDISMLKYLVHSN